MYRDVINHTEHERENQGRKCRYRPVSFGLSFGALRRKGRERVEIGQISVIKNQQNTVHIAEALVVLVNKLTLGAPFHAISWNAGY
jgi:hypothetical protein